MRIGVFVVGVSWLVGACGGTVSAPDPGQANGGAAPGIGAAGAPSSAAHCPALASTPDAGLGTCPVARALLQCTSSSPDSGTCECLSDDPTSCVFCKVLPAEITCVNQCAANEYAMSCGGPPIVNGDGSGSYQSPPPNCKVVGNTPGGNEFACCPCQ